MKSSILEVCLLLCCITCIQGLPDINELFSSILGSNANEKMEEIDDEEVNVNRVKRQFSNNIGDSSTEVHIAESSVLPTLPNKQINMRYMPTLSNGHIGFTPYSDAIYLNGLFNGVDGESHRAKIPALIMSKTYLGTETEEKMARVKRKFSLNAATGVFMERIESDYMEVEHRMYVHQKYNRLFVSDIYAKARQHHHAAGGTIFFNYSNPVSPDFNGFVRKRFQSDYVMEGTTKQAEAGKDLQTVYVFWIEAPPKIEIGKVGIPVNHTFLMAIDRVQANAQDEFQAALRILYQDADRGAGKLLREHEDAWAKTWARGKLEVEGSDLALKKIVMFSQYYLLSNMPAYDPYLKPQRQDHFYGVGRQSLGKGSLGEDQQGHVFWDNEMYILLAVLPLHPQMAKHILRYRSALRQAAVNYAQQSGDKGIRFPWESAYSGMDVTPAGTCDGCKERQIHIGASIAFAIRQYFSMTRDKDYLTNPDYAGCDLMKGIADYYAEKAVFDNDDGRYHIADVMGPDDFHDHQTNDAYTNAVISLALHYSRYMACMCSRSEREEIPDKYIIKALYLKLPFDNIAKLHYQSEQYERDENKTIKQASVVMMGYPLNWNMSRDVQKNDLEFYEKTLTAETPAMTQSFMTVGWKFVNDYAKTMSTFRSSYENYVIQPFKVWSEFHESGIDLGHPSTVNFLPGMGGLLQSIIYGFAGLRIRPEMIEFHNPQPPEGLNIIRLKGFQYLEANLTITIYTGNKVDIEVEDTGQYRLVLVRNYTYGRGSEESLTRGTFVTIENTDLGFYIYSSQGTSCDHPRDYIYMPWGYRPSTTTTTTTNTTTTTTRPAVNKKQKNSLHFHLHCFIPLFYIFY